MADGITSVYGCRDPDRFMPLAPDHPAIGRVCPECAVALKTADRIMFVNGKPASEEDAAKEVAGRPFNMEMDLGHQHCAIEALKAGKAVAYE